MGGDDDLSERHRRGTLLQIGAALLERSGHLFITDVDGLCLLAQLGKRLLLEILTAILLDESFAIFLGRAEPRFAELVPILLVGAELRAGLLDLSISSGSDVSVRYLELHLLGFLDENLFVDEVAKDGASQRSLSGRVCGKLQALSAPLIDGSKNITPEERLIADDRDDTIDRQ